MMKFAAVAVLLVAVAVEVALAADSAAGDKYGSELDHVDVSALIADDRRVKALLACVLDNDETKCNENAKIFKKYVGEIITTDCKKCSKQQDTALGKLFIFISENHAEEMKRILQNYDPKGEALAKYGEKWRKDGIKV